MRIIGPFSHTCYLIALDLNILRVTVSEKFWDLFTHIPYNGVCLFTAFKVYLIRYGIAFNKLITGNMTEEPSVFSWHVIDRKR